MEYNPKMKRMEIMPANKWVNFMKSFRVKNNDNYEEIERKKDKKKDEIREIQKMVKLSTALASNKGKGRKGQKKKKGNILGKNKEDDDSEDEEINNSKSKRKKIEFKEDSHSSEVDPSLEEIEEDDIWGDKEDKKKKEEDNKGKNNEGEKSKDESKGHKLIGLDEDGEEDEDDDDCFDGISSDENIDNDFYPLKPQNEQRMADALNILLSKKDRMTFDEILKGLCNDFDQSIVEEKIDILLDENTSHFIDKDGVIYYFKK